MSSHMMRNILLAEVTFIDFSCTDKILSCFPKFKAIF